MIAGLASNALVRLTLEGERVTGEERLLRDAGRLRAVAKAADGALWVITDEANRRVLRVVPAPR
ncbi:MAG: PQQ-dependent sugar dehydrogenase [Alphaproteobacteria bacterium]